MVFITQAAINLVAAPPDSALRPKHCTYPDEALLQVWGLMFEGHFFGDTLPGKQAISSKNTIRKRCLSKALKKITHGLNEDIMRMRWRIT
jgi:hypothetical protein